MKTKPIRGDENPFLLQSHNSSTDHSTVEFSRAQYGKASFNAMDTPKNELVVEVDPKVKPKKSYCTTMYLSIGLFVTIISGFLLYVVAFDGAAQLGLASAGGADPSPQPTASPSSSPSSTLRPTSAPSTLRPTAAPSAKPTATPTRFPTRFPTASPTPFPSRSPSRSPTPMPSTRRPTPRPSVVPGEHIKTTLVGLPLTTELQNMIASATAKWNAIVGGTPVVGLSVGSRTTFADWRCALSSSRSLETNAGKLTKLNLAIDYLGSKSPTGRPVRTEVCGSMFAKDLSGSKGRDIPGIARMQLYKPDIENLLNRGKKSQVKNLIVQGIGHALGLGYAWNGGSFAPASEDLVRNRVLQRGIVNLDADPHYIGHGARTAYSALLGRDSDIPVEDGSVFGAGLTNNDILYGKAGEVVDFHWRQKAIPNEIMSPTITTGSHPISIITLRSLEDMGYAVDTSKAEYYRLP